MTPFERAVGHTLGLEGGYSDNPNDTGGKTMLGITEAVARRHGWRGPMQDMPRNFALNIYRLDYWNALSLDKIAAMSEPIAFELFDTGVNCGTDRAGEFLQRSLNVLNRGGRDYRDIPVDGEVGPQTLGALAAFLKRRPEREMLKALNCLQGARYIRLAELRAANEDFVNGWIAKRVEI